MAADGLIDELGERALGDGATAIDDHRARAARFRLLEMVRGQQQRRSLRGEVRQHVVDAIPALGIHADSWLVEQDDSRTMENAARDVQPPLHAARELLDGLRCAIAETRAIERPVDLTLQISALRVPAARRRRRGSPAR